MEQNRIFEQFSLVKITFILKAKAYFIYCLYLKVLSVCYKIDLKQVFVMCKYCICNLWPLQKKFLYKSNHLQQKLNENFFVLKIYLSRKS